MPLFKWLASTAFSLQLEPTKDQSKTREGIASIKLASKQSTNLMHISPNPFQTRPRQLTETQKMETSLKLLEADEERRTERKQRNPGLGLFPQTAQNRLKR